MTSITNGHARRIVLLSAAILLTTTLAGCTPAARAGFMNKPAAAETSATPTPTVAAPKPGDTLSDAQAIALRISLPKNGDWAYKTTAGVNVFINSHQPLPDVVKADFSAQIIGAAQASKTAGDPTNGLFSKKLKNLRGAAGKSIVLITMVYTYLAPSFEKEGWVWANGIPRTDGKSSVYPTKAEAISLAQTYINAQDDPSTWEIVVAE